MRKLLSILGRNLFPNLIDGDGYIILTKPKKLSQEEFMNLMSSKSTATNGVL